jgi:hypothetical protein
MTCIGSAPVVIERIEIAGQSLLVLGTSSRRPAAGVRPLLPFGYLRVGILEARQRFSVLRAKLVRRSITRGSGRSASRRNWPSVSYFSCERSQP